MYLGRKRGKKAKHKVIGGFNLQYIATEGSKERAKHSEKEKGKKKKEKSIYYTRKNVLHSPIPKWMIFKN